MALQKRAISAAEATLALIFSTSNSGLLIILSKACILFSGILSLSKLSNFPTNPFRSYKSPFAAAQSVFFSPNRVQIPENTISTIGGGLGIVLNEVNATLSIFSTALNAAFNSGITILNSSSALYLIAKAFSIFTPTLAASSSTIAAFSSTISDSFSTSISLDAAAALDFSNSGFKSVNLIYKSAIYTLAF